MWDGGGSDEVERKGGREGEQRAIHCLFEVYSEK